jgi:CheY-like chemotaxis protein
MSFKLLVVDDEPAILNVIKAIVEPLGCDVVTIQDSRLAAKLVNMQKFDGILVDAKMPHLDGFELTRRIRASPSNGEVPILMLTGNDDVQTMREAFKAGITMFLGKPITQERLTRVVNVLRSALLKEKRRYARLIFRTPVTCKWGDHGPRHLKSNSVDISEDGMALVEAEDLNLGLELGLEFKLPGAVELLKLRAKVVRKIPPDGAGVQFINLAPNDRNAIQSYIIGFVKS